jgi:hypothetical protein
MHKEYELVNVKQPEQKRQEEDALTGLTEVENAVVDYVEHSEEPVTLDVLKKHFSGADSILDSLAKKGVLAVNLQGIITVVGNTYEGTLSDKGDPLSSDEDVRSSFSRTMGQGSDDELDYERAFQDPESVSWARIKNKR